MNEFRKFTRSCPVVERSSEELDVAAVEDSGSILLEGRAYIRQLKAKRLGLTLEVNGICSGDLSAQEGTLLTSFMQSWI